MNRNNSSATLPFVKIQLLTTLGVFILLTGCAGARLKNEYLVAGTLWYQTSGEARALQYQAFHLARLVLERDLADKKKKGKRAIIVDLDETVIDNGPFEGKIIQSGDPFPLWWPAWVEKSAARPIAGATEFLQFAANHNVQIFYITNRDDKTRKQTMENLKKISFPDVSDETLICKTTEWSKESRRARVAKDYRVVLLMGDNLNDFSDLYAKQLIPDRLAKVEGTREKFGTEFIVLPNPMYGDWEDALYDHKPGLSDSEKSERRYKLIKAF